MPEPWQERASQWPDLNHPARFSQRALERSRFKRHLHRAKAPAVAHLPLDRLPRRAAVAVQDPQLRGAGHPPAPEVDRVAVAEAEPRAAGPARARLPAQGETFAEPAAGFGVGRTTAWRYAEEVTALLAARAPKLRQAVRDAKKAGHAYVILASAEKGKALLASFVDSFASVRVADWIESRIRSGELKPGSRLPPERELARDCGVAYDTVRRAAMLLRERGLIITVHGRGTYVA